MIQLEDNRAEELNLQEIFKVLLDKKSLILLITSVFSILSILIALLIPNSYTSTSLLAPTTSEESLSSRLGQFSNLAGIAGVTLPSEGNSKTQEAVERIKSFDFFQDYLLPVIKLEDLLAVKRWDAVEETLVYKKRLFDADKNKWVRNASFPKKTTPSAQEAYEDGYKRILSLSVDKKTGFVTLSISHKSPLIAKEWLDLIIFNINERMRELDIEKAQNSIKFLEESTKSTSLQSLQEAIAKLLESQMQNLMLASSNKDYVFKTLDAPIVPEEKSGPSRAIIVIVGTFLGLLFSFLIIIGNQLVRLPR